MFMFCRPLCIYGNLPSSEYWKLMLLLHLSKHGIEKLWLSFSTSKNNQFFGWDERNSKVAPICSVLFCLSCYNHKGTSNLRTIFGWLWIYFKLKIYSTLDFIWLHLLEKNLKIWNYMTFFQIMSQTPASMFCIRNVCDWSTQSSSFVKLK